MDTTTADRINDLDTVILSHIRRTADSRTADSRPVDEYRARIAGTTNAESMWLALADMADQQVRAAQWARVDDIARLKEYTPHQALAIVVKGNLDTILRGANDDFSGRGNDLRRVQHHALCQWTEGARDILKLNGLDS